MAFAGCGCASLGSHSVSNDQHPDHQFWSNRGTTNGAIERLQLRAHALQVEKLVDPPKQVVSPRVAWSYGTSPLRSAPAVLVVALLGALPDINKCLTHPAVP
jgi:hypothetical protein